MVPKGTVPTSVATLGAIPAPPKLPATTRLSPVETTLYVVDATLTKYRFNDDSDYHLVLSDSTGKTMIVEMPHPDCVGATSPFKAAISAARSAFNQQLRATTNMKTASIPVRVYGVGFFDSLHGQIGVAPNGIELHPVLRIEFAPTASPALDPVYPLRSDADRVFSWAESVYPELFPKDGTAGTYQSYKYRFYAATGNYLATSAGRVVVHNGRDWNFLDVGALSNYLWLAAMTGY